MIGLLGGGRIVRDWESRMMVRRTVSVERKRVDCLIALISMKTLARGQLFLSNITGWRVVFFVYGALTHWLMLKSWVYFAYSPLADSSVATHPLTTISITLLGGIFLSGGMSHFRSRAEQGGKPLLLMLRGGLYSILATWLTLTTFFVGCSVALAISVIRRHGVTHMLLIALLALVDVFTYGLAAFLHSLPYSFGFGLLIAWATIYFRSGAKLRGA